MIDYFSIFREGTIATTRSGQIDDDRAGAHLLYGFFTDEYGSLTATNLGGGDDHVRLGGPSGHFFALPLQEVFTLRDGKIVEQRGLTDHFSIFQQLGLMPQPDRAGAA